MERVASQVLHPYLILLVLCLLAVLLLWRRRWETRGRLLSVTLPLLLLYAYSMPAVAYVALGSLEWRYPPLVERPADVEAIVVLGGGMRPPDSIRPQSEPGPSTLYRCLEASRLYHQGPSCTVLVSGGKVNPAEPGPPVAEPMRDLLMQLGVPASDIVMEKQSRSTYENAAYSARILKERGVQRAVLVTDAAHLLRSRRSFRAQGIEMIPAGANYRATRFHWTVWQFLPSLDAAQANYDSFHEWVGMGWYWARSRF